MPYLYALHLSQLLLKLLETLLNCLRAAVILRSSSITSICCIASCCMLLLLVLPLLRCTLPAASRLALVQLSHLLQKNLLLPCVGIKGRRPTGASASY